LKKGKEKMKKNQRIYWRRFKKNKRNFRKDSGKFKKE
jgi:hypothetical protein